MRDWNTPHVAPHFPKNAQNSSSMTSYSKKLPKITGGNALHAKMQNFHLQILAEWNTMFSL